VDESGDAGSSPGSSRHFVLAGIAMFEGAWRKITSQMDSLQASFFPQAATKIEFHFKHLRHGVGLFAQLSDDDRAKLHAEISTLWKKHHGKDFSSFAVTIDKYTCGALEHTIEREAFEQLSSRFNSFLKRLWSQGLKHKGAIVFDERTQAQDRLLRQFQIEFQKSGTRWAVYDNVVETVFTVSSKDSRLLQLSDYLAGAVFQAVENGNTAYLRPIAPHFDSEVDKEGKSVKVHGFKYLGQDENMKHRLHGLGLL
jgi:hypothetical protein